MILRTLFLASLAIFARFFIHVSFVWRGGWWWGYCDVTMVVNFLCNNEMIIPIGVVFL